MRRGFEHVVLPREHRHVAPRGRPSVDLGKLRRVHRHDPLGEHARVVEPLGLFRREPQPRRPVHPRCGCVSHLLGRRREIFGLRVVRNLVENGRLARGEPLRREHVGEREQLVFPAAVVAQRNEVGERLVRHGDLAFRDRQRAPGRLAREADAELGEDADVCATKSVDRLLAIADDQQARSAQGTNVRNGPGARASRASDPTPAARAPVAGATCPGTRRPTKDHISVELRRERG